jgi:DNA excision repair protein ERCC-2
VSDAGDVDGADGDRTVPRERVDADWTEWFPFDPYPQQVDGVERALSVLREGGYLALEGACGTGKTLIALAAGLEALREDRAERVLAVTPVKQQLRQFVTELRAINRARTGDGNGGDGAPEPLAGLVLVGKGDLLPYAREGVPPYDGGVQSAAGEAREVVVELVRRDSSVPLDVEPGALDGRVTACETADCERPAYGGVHCPDHRERDDDAPWYDPVRAAVVCDLIERLPGERLETAGVQTPYPADVPHATDVVAVGRADELPGDARGFLDPFYARFLADGEWPGVDFAAGEANVLDSEALVRAAAARGTCPHEAMAALAADADALVGNYYHAFDPTTRRLTEEKAGVVDDGTVLVVDEAHVLEERVRDLLSTTLGLATLRTARRDVRLAREYLSGTGGGPDADPTKHERDARGAVREVGADEGDLKHAVRVVEWLLKRVDREIEEYLDGEYGDWSRRFAEGSLPEEDHAIPLRDPGTPGEDRLSAAAREAFGDDVWTRASAGLFAAAAVHEADEQTDRTPGADAVGATLREWGLADHEAHLRLIELTRSESPAGELPDWAGAYNASLTLFNCLPRQALARTFETFAGGVLMSATLEPFDVFREVSGLDALVAGDDGSASDGDADGGETADAPPRRVETARYGLAFPAENRASWTVDLPPFTYRNRGAPTTDYDEMTPTRAAHASALARIARSPGNVLCCLPSYAEAEWAVEFLRERCDKPVLRDRSSDRAETDAMLGRFFQSDGVARVLVTSARGTVTEGVDYDGEKLHTVAVVGVPYANTSTPRMEAVVAAYDRAFGGGDGDGANGASTAAGFEYAVKVPAVRKARQALGRVIRGPDERGTRLLLDRRYRPDAPRSVDDALADWEREEFETVSPDMLDLAFERFWGE